MKISLAAVPYFWTKEAYFDFYEKVASSSVDLVYLGETVCSKRRSMTFQDWLELANKLTAAGKQVILSTMTLLEADSELKYLTSIAKQTDYLVEANDLAAVQVASQDNNPFVAGCAINIYNNQSLQHFHRLGMSRWCVPVELGKQDLEPMVKKAKALGVEVEYQVFGRIPLAYSARCFTARHHQLPKDDCQFKCNQNEQGILIKTQEGDSFAQINGIQTQSARVNNLLPRWQEVVAAGVDVLRIVPVGIDDTLELLDQLNNILNDKNPEPLDETKFSQNYEFCNGYWLQIEGMSLVV